MYVVKSPWWLKKFYPKLTWEIKGEAKNIYLTFDDGPHPIATPFVLDALKKFKAEGTFFCIGKNVKSEPEIYRRILDEGHAVGNHTNHHVNGWKTNDTHYLNEVESAGEYIHSRLFRPPYGKIKQSQIALLLPTFSIIMWDVLSADFDTTVTPEKSLKNVVLNTRSGSIVVFHDSVRAFERLKYALPATLQHFADKGYSFKRIPY